MDVLSCGYCRAVLGCGYCMKLAVKMSSTTVHEQRPLRITANVRARSDINRSCLTRTHCPSGLDLMLVSTLFDTALHVVMNEFLLFEQELRFLPSNVKTRVAQRMGKRGFLCERNASLVSRKGYRE